MAKTGFNVVLTDLNNTTDNHWEIFEDLNEELIPDDAEGGEQTDKACNKANDLILDEINKAQSHTFVLKCHSQMTVPPNKQRGGSLMRACRGDGTEAKGVDCLD